MELCVGRDIAVIEKRFPIFVGPVLLQFFMTENMYFSSNYIVLINFINISHLRILKMRIYLVIYLSALIQSIFYIVKKKQNGGNIPLKNMKVSKPVYYTF